MIEIKENTRKLQCDLCNSRNTVTVVKKGLPLSLNPIMCRNDLRDITEAGMKFFGITPADSAEAEKLSAELEASSAEIKRLEVENGILKAEIEVCRKEITELKKAVKAANSTKKGGKSR
jgi:predicted nuclease with TOPRIM domain